MRRVPFASLAVVASLAAPAAAAAGWSKPAVLVPPGKLAYQATLATAADGTTIVVWDQYDSGKNTYSLLAATRTPQGKVSRRTLGPAANAVAKPALAVGGDGTFAVAWEYPGKGTGGDSLAVRIVRPGESTFEPASTVSPANMSTDYGAGDGPSVAVDDAGTVYVTWEGVYSGRGGKHDEVVVTDRADGARTWSPVVRLSSPAADSHGARVAAAGKGHAAVSWAETNSSVWTSIASAGRFGPAKLISGATYESSPASIAVAATGKAALLWEQSGAHNSHRIAAKVTTSHAFPARTQFLSGPSVSHFPAVALASHGAGTSAWEAEVAGGWEIDAAALSGATWGRATRLEPKGYAATYGFAPVVAANDERAVVAWAEKDLNRASFIGAKVRVGSRWTDPANFPGLSAPVVSVPQDPVGPGPVAGAMVWLSTNGLQISILK